MATKSHHAIEIRLPDYAIRTYLEALFEPHEIPCLIASLGNTVQVLRLQNSSRDKDRTIEEVICVLVKILTGLEPELRKDMDELLKGTFKLELHELSSNTFEKESQHILNNAVKKASNPSFELHRPEDEPF